MRRQKRHTSARGPYSPSPSNAMDPSSEYRTVFETLLIGSFVLIAVVSLLLVVSYFAFHNNYVLSRIFLCVVGLIYLGIGYMVWIRNRRAAASKILISFYFFISVIVLLGWGLNTSFGLLIFAITIILAGILLGARHTLYAAVCAIISIFAIQTFITLHHTALFSNTVNPSHFGDAAAYSTLLGILALISWLFGRQTEYLFLKSRRAEQALLNEKKLLEIRVRERTRQLQKAQLEEMEQLYQFAEMGQLSAALLHDLANHLSVLNFDIADLKKQQHSQTVHHVEESISYLDHAVSEVRKQLQGKNEAHHFDAVACLEESIKILAPKTAEARADITLISPKNHPPLYGDPLRLNHIVGILIRNAIEAYPKTAKEKPISVLVEVVGQKLLITVRDKGVGITPTQRKKLFSPLQSSKKDGLGIGLFIAKKITETHFKGNLALADTTDSTDFVIELPLAHS
ncbi:MAG TPA: ATP-binding protein [Candidatus Saccharimonadales bacterium]|nr:ATP-binding protein [Candidatus Saccharimonadales bacterium]